MRWYGSYRRALIVPVSHANNSGGTAARRLPYTIRGHSNGGRGRFLRTRNRIASSSQPNRRHARPDDGDLGDARCWEILIDNRQALAVIPSPHRNPGSVGGRLD